MSTARIIGLAGTGALAAMFVFATSYFNKGKNLFKKLEIPRTCETPPRDIPPSYAPSVAIAAYNRNENGNCTGQGHVLGPAFPTVYPTKANPHADASLCCKSGYLMADYDCKTGRTTYRCGQWNAWEGWNWNYSVDWYKDPPEFGEKCCVRPVSEWNTLQVDNSCQCMDPGATFFSSVSK